MVLLLDQPADRERERDVRAGCRASAGVGSDGAARQLVEPVVDRHELARVVPGSLEEAANRVGDRDQRPRAAREGAVDVAERAEQVAVVVVPRRDGRRSRREAGDRAVDVGVDEVRVQKVGPLRADGADHVARHPGADVEAAADAAVGDVQLVELVVEALRVAALDVEAEEARVDAGGAQGGQEREQVALRAADALQLVHVEHLHAEQPPVDRLEPSAIGPIAKRVRTSCGTCPAQPGPQLAGRAASSTSRRASPSTSPTGSR